MPALIKKRFYDVGATQVSVDVRGIWGSDTAARAASAPGHVQLHCKLVSHVMLSVVRDHCLLS